MILLENISKTFHAKDNTVEAVRDVSLRIDKGEIYGIIGYSGAGKSTLVRCINLLERPTAGKVYVDGTELTALSDGALRKERKKIGMIFQQFNLMASRTVEENIALPLEGSGKTREEIVSRVKDLLAYVDLSDKAKAYPSQLSGGQKQRVAIARALANEPKVLLCDEATSALDPQTTKSILSLLNKLNKELGITVVIITHEMSVIKRICHRVAVMENGEVVEEGNVYDIFASPQKQITKEFVSTTSVLSSVFELIEDDSPVVKLERGDVLIRIRYLQADVSEPLISEVSKRFDVTFNILFSNLEIVDHAPIGGTVGILRGSEEGVNNAIRYFEEKNVKTEVLKRCTAYLKI